MLVCSWSAGLAACLASGSDTLVPCSRMTPLSKACLIYLAYRLSHMPPLHTNVFKCLIITVVANKKEMHKKRQHPFVCIPTPLPLRSVDIFKNILSEVCCVLYVGLPLWHVCDSTSFLHMGVY